ncbi:TetR/AcrR family transcriptional regulator [Rhodococcus koreensis]
MTAPKRSPRSFPNRDGYSGRGRPSKPLITKAAVVETALSLVDEKGPDALSMRQLAQRLGLDAVSSLYNHFKNKTEIKAAVARRVVADIPRPRKGEVGSGWMLAAVVAYRRALIAHPHAISLVVETMPRSFAAANFDRATAAMRESGVGPDRILTLLDALEALAVGSAITSTTHAALRPSDAEEWTLATEHLMLDDSERFELSCRVLIENLYTAMR